VNRIRTIDNLADLDRADTGQALNAVELELELVLVERPKAFAQACKIASADLVETRLDHANLVIVVEIKLNRSQRQRDERAEQQHGGQQAETDAAAQPVKYLG